MNTYIAKDFDAFSDTMLNEAWVAAKENRRKLDECKRHLFHLPKPPYILGQRATCEHCGGSLGLVEVNQYVRGYEAAGGNCDDVCPGFRG